MDREEEEEGGGGQKDWFLPPIPQTRSNWELSVNFRGRTLPQEINSCQTAGKNFFFFCFVFLVNFTYILNKMGKNTENCFAF